MAVDDRNTQTGLLNGDALKPVYVLAELNGRLACIIPAVIVREDEATDLALADKFFDLLFALGIAVDLHQLTDLLLYCHFGKKIRDLGHEYGAVTGRERRCGWIDLVALKYAVMINGVTKLIMMKSDVLDDFDTIKACVAYNINGEETDEFPFDIKETNFTPVYKEFKGWKKDMTKTKKTSEFPEEYNDYLDFLEDYLEVPIKIVSVGPDREQTIVRYTEE